MTKRPSVLPVVAAALFDETQRVLVQQRPVDKHHGGLWEFPGGKVEAYETAETALVRELAEELGIIVDERDLVPAAFATRSHGDRQLLLLLYRCERWDGDPRALEAAGIAWHHLGDLSEIAMPPADRGLVMLLMQKAV